MSAKNKLLFEAIRPNLVCPISGQYFLDPVTIPSGITYEKSAILMYFSENGDKPYLECPVTKKQIFDYDLSTRYDGSIKDLHPNLYIKRIVDQMIKDGLIDPFERFRLHLFEMPISGKCSEYGNFVIYDCDIDAFCDELRYSEYSIQQLYDEFRFHFGTLRAGPGPNTLHQNASKRIFDAIMDHVNHDKIKGVEEFMAFINFCVRRLHHLEDYDLNFILNTFELEHIPDELFLDNDIVKILFFEKTFNKLLRYREKEVAQFIGYLSTEEWFKLLQNLLFPNQDKIPRTLADSINYNFLIYLAENFPVAFNQNFSRWIDSFSYTIKSERDLLHKELKFIHIVRTRFPEEFKRSFDIEILNLILDKYEKIRDEHLHVIGWYDLDKDTYVLKINRNYHNSVESRYLNVDSAFWLFGTQSLVRKVGDKNLSFSELERVVKTYRRFDELQIDEIEERYKYSIKMNKETANLEDL